MSVRYKSTRGVNSEALSFEEVVLGGLATDGGLFVPESIPQFSYEDIEMVLNFPSLNVQVCQLTIFFTDAWIVFFCSGRRDHIKVCWA